MEDLLRKGTRKFIDGDNKLAIKIFNRVLRKEPRNTKALIHRGLVYLDIKRYSNAVEDFTYALHIDKYNTDAYRNRALAYFGMKKEQLAMKDYNKSLELV